ncbi:MAG: hypothetical protein WC998_01930 [Candidatus Paceibacterota bacterium]|jgi:hypothetical protein
MNQNKKGFTPIVIIIILIIVILLGWAGYWIMTQNQPPNLIKQNSVIDPRNATYIIFEKQVRLVNGISEKEGDPGSASKIITKYFGNEVKADFNGDGIDDIAFILTWSGGGSGTFYFVSAVLSQGNSFKGTNAMLIGDRIAPQTTEFQNGEIIVNYADRKPGDSMADIPSVGVSKYFKIINDTIVEVKK